MLLVEAAAARARTMAELERQAERLAVSVLLPIGVCVLPSFIVLGVLPVLLAVMGSLGPIS
jgi:tight adherence protein B